MLNKILQPEFGLVAALLFVNVAVLVGAFLFTRRLFPSRIREAMENNSVRLNGSFSKRRRSIERLSYESWICKTMGVITVLLMVGNIAVVIVHRSIVPLPIVAGVLGQFDLDANQWREKVHDPSRSAVSARFERWQKTTGSDLSLSASLAMVPIFGIILLAAAVVTLIVVARIQIQSLVHLEAKVQGRHREYLMRDMESRFKAVERGAARQAKTVESPVG